MIDPTIDWIPLLLLVILSVIFFIVYRWSLKFAKPQLFFSHLESIKTDSLGWRSRIVRWPRIFELLVLFFFGLAFINPHYFKEVADQTSIDQTLIPKEGVAIYLVLDQSGSMGQEVTVVSSKGRFVRESKLNFVESVTQDFVNKRSQDLIGLVSFARTAQVLSPLTLDHKTLLKQLKRLKVVKKRENEGTAIGYAIYKTANLIAATRYFADELQKEGEPSYKIKNAAIVLITDGIQETNPLDSGNEVRTIGIMQAAQFAKENSITLYIVNVEPKIGMEAFGPHRRLMTRAADLTGGKFYFVDDIASVEAIFKEIDQLEESTILEKRDPSQNPALYKKVVFAPYLIFLGLCVLFLSILLRTLVVRQVP